MAKTTKSTGDAKPKKAKSTKKVKQIVIEPSLVQGRKEIPIDNLLLDPKNYRIKYLNLKKQSDIQEHLLLHEDGKTMVKKVLSAGQIYEEPYVIPSGTKYLTLEGNTRVSAVKEINTSIADGNLIPSSKRDFKKVKCIVLKPNLSEAKIRRLLAQAHLAGKHQWKATSKGAMIWDMINEDSESYQSVGDLLGMSKKEVEKLYNAYKMTVQFGKKYPTLNYTHYFSYWHEFFKKKELQEQAAKDPGFKDWVMQLVADNKITEHKQLRTLGDFWGRESTPEALKKTLSELNKFGMSKAKEAFVNYSPKGSLNKVLSCTTVLGGITAAALQNTTVQNQLPSALDNLIVTAKNVKKQVESIKQNVTSAVTGAVTP